MRMTADDVRMKHDILCEAGRCGWLATYENAGVFPATLHRFEDTGTPAFSPPPASSVYRRALGGY
jgi:hypothetical protein